ncbi:MAG TPA: hypothetical protein VIF14_13845 [Alphaproteobacteria bacterium]|jgi:ABC-type phosphate transport system permease subunit
MANGADFTALLDASEREIKEKAKTVADEIDLIKAGDRSKIAKLIINVFCIVVTITLIIFGILLFFHQSLSADQKETWLKIAGLIKEILGSILLPIVTLIIGFYFGVEKAQTNAGK